MRKRLRSSLVVSLVTVMALSGNAASAHHSFAAMYDASKPVRLVGVLTKVEWTNPHSFFFLNVKASDGTSNTWACEGAGPGALSRRGFNRGDIKVGDHLIVDGYLAKSGAKIIDARRVTLANGRVVSGGTPGDGGPESATATAAAADSDK
jgi:hypothetical protein